jgi:flagellar protein FlbT
MALKITLKPHEKMILGGAVVRCGVTKCQFIVENNVPILRQNNILSIENADSPARRIYLAIQMMYVDDAHITHHQEIYWKLVRQFLEAAPSALELIDQTNELILSGNYYKALKSARQLIDYEQEVIGRVTNCC